MATVGVKGLLAVGMALLPCDTLELANLCCVRLTVSLWNPAIATQHICTHTRKQNSISVNWWRAEGSLLLFLQSSLLSHGISFSYRICITDCFADDTLMTAK